MKRSTLARLALIPAVALATASAHAAINVAPVVTEINDTIGPIGLIGAAVLIVVVSVKAFKWVRSAIS